MSLVKKSDVERLFQHSKLSWIHESQNLILCWKAKGPQFRYTFMSEALNMNLRI